MLWENFSHDADIGIRGFGKTPDEAFAMAIKALTAVVTNPDKVAPEIKIKIVCEDEDIELLFYDLINSVVYEMDTKKMVFAEAKICINESHLEAELWGEKIKKEKHDPAAGIKGATMTELKVIPRNGQWIAQCIVDV